jgi:pantetheine-phosphate adenylyltransferase
MVHPEKTMSAVVVTEAFTQNRPTLGIYAGSFDPFTRGHMDIVTQGLAIFDTIEVAVGRNPKKTGMFSVEERCKLVDHALREEGLPVGRVQVTSFTGSLMNHAKTRNANAVVRGLRQVSDFNDEFTLHGVFERTMAIPVVYLICRQEFLHVSSSTARELASLNESVDWLVHPTIARALASRVQRAFAP